MSKSLTKEFIFPFFFFSRFECYTHPRVLLSKLIMWWAFRENTSKNCFLGIHVYVYYITSLQGTSKMLKRKFSAQKNALIRTVKTKINFEVNIKHFLNFIFLWLLIKCAMKKKIVWLNLLKKRKCGDFRKCAFDVVLRFVRVTVKCYRSFYFLNILFLFYLSYLFFSFDA